MKFYEMVTIFIPNLPRQIKAVNLRRHRSNTIIRVNIRSIKNKSIDDRNNLHLV
jgi:hypothetical protein